MATIDPKTGDLITYDAPRKRIAKPQLISSPIGKPYPEPFTAL